MITGLVSGGQPVDFEWLMHFICGQYWLLMMETNIKVHHLSSLHASCSSLKIKFKVDIFSFFALVMDFYAALCWVLLVTLSLRTKSW